MKKTILNEKYILLSHNHIFPSPEFRYVYLYTWVDTTVATVTGHPLVTFSHVFAMNIFFSIWNYNPEHVQETNHHKLLTSHNILFQDAFLEWEVNDDPEEQEGKGVALKSCTQFIQWLKTAEPEEDEDAEKQRVSGS